MKDKDKQKKTDRLAEEYQIKQDIIYSKIVNDPVLSTKSKFLEFHNEMNKLESRLGEQLKKLK